MSFSVPGAVSADPPLGKVWPSGLESEELLDFEWPGCIC